MRASSLTELRKRPKGARYNAATYRKALRGELTTSNTKKGSAARSAADHVAYVRRIERAERNRRSRAQARGHPRSIEPGIGAVRAHWTDVATTRGLESFETQGIESRRTGQHMRDTRLLLEGRLEPSRFERRWRRRRREAGGFELLADADRVLELHFTAGPPPLERYRRITAGPAR
jgi:hypothetical protein